MQTSEHRHHTVKCMPPRTWPRYDHDVRSLTFKTFSAVYARMKNICAKFHWNPSTKQRERYRVTRYTSDNVQWIDGRTDGRTDNRPT